jgi:hypothetical protein
LRAISDHRRKAAGVRRHKVAFFYSVTINIMLIYMN